jgi:hypothetical protein
VIAGGDAPPRVLLAPTFQPESFTEIGETATRDSAGEYLPVGWLADGDLAIASPIQDAKNDRFGFTWWRGAHGTGTAP